MTLGGKVAVVTGGSRGIGREIAVTLARAGADVAIIYGGQAAAAAEAVTAVMKEGVRCVAYQCDVSDYSAVSQTVAAIVSEFGTVDILVNNAGITADRLLMQMSEQDFDTVIDINLKGTFNMIRHICPVMVKRRSGKIINISSVSGLMGNVGQANYAASKAGLIGLSKTVAKEYAARNINCNVIAPGFIRTEMTDKLSDKAKEGALAAIPLKRMGEPEQVAGLALFLAGPGADYITGEVIRVDGGLCM